MSYNSIIPKKPSFKTKQRIKGSRKQTIELKLFISGMTLKSIEAVKNVNRVINSLSGYCHLEIVDVYQQPELARIEQVFITPTLIKKNPLPIRTKIGDLTNIERITMDLGLTPQVFEIGNEAKVMSRETDNALKSQIKNLKMRLQELEEAICAIRTCKIDSLIVSTIDGDQIFTLEGAEQPYRVFIEEMNQGAILLSEQGIILYCNKALAKMVKEDLEKIIGQRIQNYISNSDIDFFNEMLLKIKFQKSETDNIINLITQDGSFLQTQMSACMVLENKIILTITSR